MSAPTRAKGNVEDGFGSFADLNERLDRLQEQVQETRKELSRLQGWMRKVLDLLEDHDLWLRKLDPDRREHP